MRKGTGLHRTQHEDGNENTVWVVDGSISFDIGEMLYRQRGYAPAFDELPWEHARGDDPVGIDWVPKSRWPHKAAGAA